MVGKKISDFESDNKITGTELLYAVDDNTDVKLSTQQIKDFAIAELALSKADKSEIIQGQYEFGTYAEFNTAKANLPLNCTVVINELPTGTQSWGQGSNRWNGTTLTKSAYDPLAQAKADATTKANAAEANAKNYADALGSKIGYYQTENIFNPAQASAVGFYANGIPNGQSGSISALDYYPVTANQDVWIRGIGGNTVIAVYDSLKTYIGVIDIRTAVDGVLKIASSYGSKVPAFIRISSYGATTLTGIELGYGNIRPPVILMFGEIYGKLLNPEFTEEIAKKVIDPGNQALNSVVNSNVKNTLSGHIDFYENLFNPNQELLQGFYLATGILSPYTTSPNAYVSLEFIPVPISRRFFAHGLGSNGNFIQLADINKQPIAVVETKNVINGIYKVPAQAGSNNKDVHYVRFGSYLGLDAIRSGAVSIGYLAEGSPPPSTPPVYGGESALLSDSFLQEIANQLGVKESPLSGKKWYAIGDSITANTYSTINYCDVLAARHGATVVKYGTNGATVSRATGQPENQIKSETYLEIPTDNPPDLITVALGTNDQSVHTVPLGVMTDRVNTTFYGALHVLLSGLRVRFPLAKIAYLAPIPRESRYIVGDMTNKLYTKYKAIEEVCAYYSIPVWNGNAEFGFNPLDSSTLKSTYMPDGLHPNDAGHTWYANRIEDFILSLAK